MRNPKKIIALTLVAALTCSLLPADIAAAKKKVQLNKKKVTLKVGKKVTLKLKNIKKIKKIKWSTSKKRVASVSKKGRVTAKAVGKATITAKVGKKKYKCRVTVVKANTATTATIVPTSAPSASATNSNTTMRPTATQTNSSLSTPKATNTPISSPTKESEATAEPTLIPSDDAETTSKPTVNPSKSPVPTSEPPVNPTESSVPTSEPTVNPTESSVPTNEPTETPVESLAPTSAPTEVPAPTMEPTAIPLETPTATISPDEKDSEGRKLCQVNALTSIVETQIASGSSISADLSNSYQYVWDEDGNLTEIYWTYKNLSGEISFEEFPFLEYLSCSNNDITKIDISKNTELKTLYCFNNSLEELDITNNSKLDILYCYSNNMTELNTENNPDLRILHCYDTNITRLDISKNNKLEYLDADEDVLLILPEGAGPKDSSGKLYSQKCILSELITAQIASGSSVSTDLDDYQYDWDSNGYLTEISWRSTNLSGNLSFAGLPLEHLDCSNNDISSLELSQNTELTYLDCSDTDITYLDVRNCTNLETLYADNDAKVILPEGVELMDSEDRLYSQRNILLDIIAEQSALGSTISSDWDSGQYSWNRDGYITDIYWDDTGIVGDISFEGLPVEFINCSDNPITQIDISKNTELTTLNCSNTNISSLDVGKNTELTGLICTGTNISTLDVSNCPNIIGIDADNEVKVILPEGVEVEDYYGRLYSQRNILLDIISAQTAKGSTISSDWDDESQYLWDDGYLYDLYWINNALSGDLSFKGLSVYCINCSNNPIDKIDITANTDLEAFCCSNTNISSLDLSQNTKLTSIDCTNTNLTVLDLTNCPNINYIDVDDDVKVLLPEGIELEDEYDRLYSQRNTVLDFISSNTASGTSITTDWNDDSQYYWNNGYLTSIDWCNTGLTGEISFKGLSVPAIACGENSISKLDIAHNTNLESFYCSNTNISELDLSKNTELRYIDCTNTNISVLDLTNCPKIEEVYVDDDVKVLLPEGVELGDEYGRLYSQRNILLDIINAQTASGSSISADWDDDSQYFWNEDGYLTDIYWVGKGLTGEISLEGLPLEYFDCSDNQITKLDVSTNTELVSLFCEDNCISSLDLTNCTQLENLYTDEGVEIIGYTIQEDY